MQSLDVRYGLNQSSILRGNIFGFCPSNSLMILHTGGVRPPAVERIGSMLHHTETVLIEGKSYSTRPPETSRTFTSPTVSLGSPGFDGPAAQQRPRTAIWSVDIV
jgi:hypothetical protein